MCLLSAHATHYPRTPPCKARKKHPNADRQSEWRHITVAFVLKLLASGMTNEAILKAYPELTAEDILQVMEYAAWLAGEYHRPMPAYAEREI